MSGYIAAGLLSTGFWKDEAAYVQKPSGLLRS
jgi:hypothetical protein